MKTEQEIKERLAYIKGYQTALVDYGHTSNLEEILELKTQIKVLGWVLENSNPNCEANNDNK